MGSLGSIQLSCVYKKYIFIRFVFCYYKLLLYFTIAQSSVKTQRAWSTGKTEPPARIPFY